MQDDTREVLLVIADISGYTRFMMKNAGTLRHAQAVITELMTAIVREARLPLQIAKLEGDAVFLYAADRGRGWGTDLAAVRDRIGEMFRSFTRRALSLQLSNTCGCEACAHVDRLRLKIFIHAGQAHFYRIGRFDELAGPDVILLHRLLKNGVGADEYFLFTETAYARLGMPAEDPLYERGDERYDDIGEVIVRVRRDLSAFRFEPTPEFIASGRSPWRKMIDMAGKMKAMLFASKNRIFKHIQ